MTRSFQNKIARLIQRSYLVPEGAVKMSRKITDLGISGLEYNELLFRVENTFGIDIPDEDVTRFTTVGSLVNCVEKYAAVPWGSR